MSTAFRCETHASLHQEKEVQTTSLRSLFLSRARATSVLRAPEALTGEDERTRTYWLGEISTRNTDHTTKQKQAIPNTSKDIHLEPPDIGQSNTSYEIQDYNKVTYHHNFQNNASTLTTYSSVKSCSDTTEMQKRSHSRNNQNPNAWGAIPRQHDHEQRPRWITPTTHAETQRHTQWKKINKKATNKMMKNMIRPIKNEERRHMIAKIVSTFRRLKNTISIKTRRKRILFTHIQDRRQHQIQHTGYSECVCRIPRRALHVNDGDARTRGSVRTTQRNHEAVHDVKTQRRFLSTWQRKKDRHDRSQRWDDWILLQKIEQPTTTNEAIKPHEQPPSNYQTD